MKIKDRLNAERQAITEAYLNGESTCSLGRRYDCSNASIFLALRDWGVPLRQLKVVDANLEKIVELHKQGLSAYAITKRLGLQKNAAERALRKAGYDISHRQRTREDPLFNHEEEILARYANGEGVHLIAKDYDCQDASIIRFLERKGVERRPLRYYAYSVNEEFFDVVDTESKAYILGLFMADGNNDQKRGITRLSITDEGLCRAVAEEFSFEGKIDRMEPRKEGHLPQFRFNIGSRKLSDALARCGCVARKTYIAKVPSAEIVSDALQRHMVRGWLDGDGTITHTKSLHYSSRIVGTEAVCKGMSELVNRTLGFPGWVAPVYVGATHTTWGFTISNKEQLRAYLDWLYKDATLFLRRKFDKYLAFCRQYGLAPVTTAGRGV